MMKVLWFSPSPCSGAEHCAAGQSVSGGWLVSLEKGLREYPEIQLEIAYLSSGNGREDEFEYEGVRYYPIQPFRSCSYLRFRLARRFMSRERQEEKICRRMREIVGRSHPDVIHIHGTERPFGMVAEYVKDIPVVYSIQGIIAACVEKYYSGISRESVRKYEGLMDRLRKKSIDRDYRTFVHNAGNERRFLTDARYVIGRTDWDRRITGLFNPERKYFHIDEIMRGPFYRSQWGKSAFGTPLQLVSVFSYGPYKGFETLLRTAKLLRDNACFSFEWTVVGYRGDESYVRIAERVTGISADDTGIRFAGWKTADEMVGIMAGADVFCHFSHIDNSPNTVCEAMLLGMPVVATDVGGVPDIINDGTDGILVQEGDADAYAGVLCRLAGDFQTAAAMGRAARERALVRHDRESICRTTIGLYRDISEGTLRCASVTAGM